MCFQKLQHIQTKLNYLVYLFLGFIALKLIFYHYNIIAYPFPLDRFEGAMLLSTDLIVKGGNPFDLANQPLYANSYGILYHIAAYPFARLLGVGFTAHRLVTGLSILTSCTLLVWTMKKLNLAIPMTIGATILLYSHWLSQNTPLGVPNSLGLLLFLFSILIPWHFKYSWKSLLASIFFAVLAFFTKPYFILALPDLVLYLFLFKSKKKGILYGCFAVLFLLFSVSIANLLLECYFNNTFFSNLNIVPFYKSPYHSVLQIIAYRQRNFAIAIILAVLIIFTAVKTVKLAISKQNGDRKKMQMDFFNFDRPLIEPELDLITVCLLCSFFAFYLLLGNHLANWQTYINELISPFLIIEIFRFVDRFREKQKFIYLSFSILLFINLFTISLEFNPQFQYDTRKWEDLSALVAQHKNVYNAPTLVSILMQQKRTIYDSGHTEYFKYGAKRQILNFSFPTDRKIEEIDHQFSNKIYQALSNKAYDLVILNRVQLDYNVVSKQFKRNLYECYQHRESIPLEVPLKAKSDWWKSWILEVWEPNPLACNDASMTMQE